MMKTIDLTKQVFGRLTVKERVGSDKHGNALWRCACECENEITVVSQSLQSGHTVSCGCYKKEVLSTLYFKSMVGKIFGWLHVLERVVDSIQPSGQTKTQYLCLCTVCGNKVVVSSSNLKRGHSKSCGCLSESWIASELKKYFVENYGAILEYRVFKNPKTNYYLPYDIYLPDRKVFIEIQGKQHYIFIPKWHKTKEQFKYNRKLDKMKRKFARQNGVYVEVDLRKIKSVEQAIQYIQAFFSP